MFDKKSDYALNKRVKDAIVYISATGNPEMLTHTNFSSEVEFLRWKRWSDRDYKASEKVGRGFYDNCISLNESFDCICAVPSIEDELIGELTEAEHKKERTALLAQVRGILTEIQFRRLWMYFAEGLSEQDIAILENVGRQRISKSITLAKKKIAKI